MPLLTFGTWILALFLFGTGSLAAVLPSLPATAGRGPAAAASPAGLAEGAPAAAAPVPAAAAAGRLGAPAAVTVPAGGEVAVAVQALDAGGRVQPGVTISGQSALGTWDAATRIFRSRGTAGRGTLTLSAPGLPPVQVAVEVTPGPAAVLAVEGQKSPRPGVAETYTVTGAEDAYRNPVPLPAGAVAWSVEPAAAAAVAADGTVTFRRSGDFQVVARSGGAVGRWPVHVAGPPAAVQIAGPRELVANGETEYELQVRVVDGEGVTVAGYDYAAELELPLPEGVVLTGLDPAARDGLRRYRVRVGGGPRPLEFRAAAANPQAASGRPFRASATFPAVVPAAAGIRLQPARQHLNRSGGTLPVDVLVVDQAGARIRNSTRTVRLAVQGPATVNKEQVRAGEQVLLTATGPAGDVTLTARAEGLPAATATVTATDVGAPAGLVLSSAMAGRFLNPHVPGYGAATVLIQVVDARGLPVAGPREVTVTMARASDQVFINHTPAGQPVTVPLHPETGTGLITVATTRSPQDAPRFGGEIRLTVAAPGLAPGEIALYATAQKPGVLDPAAQVGFLPPHRLQVRAGAAVTVRLHVLDAAGLGTSNAHGHLVTLTADAGLLVDGAGGEVTVLPNKYGFADLTLAAAAPGSYRLRITGGRLAPAAGLAEVVLEVQE